MALSAVSSLRQNLLEVSEILHSKTSALALLCIHIKYAELYYFVIGLCIYTLCA